MNNHKSTVLFQFLVVPFSCLLHLSCTQTTPTIQVVPRILTKPEDIWAAIKAWESKPLSGSPAMTLPWSGAPAVGLGQWGCRGSSTSMARATPTAQHFWWARQRTKQLLPLCVCAGVSVQAECLKSARQSQVKPFSSHFSPLHLLSQVRRQWMWSNSSQLLLLQAIWESIN